MQTLISVSNFFENPVYWVKSNNSDKVVYIGWDGEAQILPMPVNVLECFKPNVIDKADHLSIRPSTQEEIEIYLEMVLLS